MCSSRHSPFYFFFNDTATTEIYTLSLHDALPIYATFTERCLAEVEEIVMYEGGHTIAAMFVETVTGTNGILIPPEDRKSTRLNSSHGYISYAVFCLKKKKKTQTSIVTSNRINQQK